MAETNPILNRIAKAVFWAWDRLPLEPESMNALKTFAANTSFGASLLELLRSRARRPRPAIPFACFATAYWRRVSFL